ncbi:MAG: cation acetate symporter, partial [Fervidobacterium sp.]
MTNVAAILMVLALLLITIGISFYTRRFTRTSVDFYLAGRKVGYFTNASAICGDYFSAASFLGVAAAVYASGLDGVWYGTGFGAAFVPVVLFLASPLRRFGEYTIPDFLYARFGNKDLARIIGIIMVQLIYIFYLAPQMYGAGTTWQVLVGAGIFGLDPYTTGVIVVVVVMAFYVAMGGMKGTTWNQMIQFWVLFTAMALVVAGGFLNGFSYPTHLKEVSKDVLKNTKTMT